jgi:hypothetical protein
MNLKIRNQVICWNISEIIKDLFCKKEIRKW